jgi:hypothetical protein
MNHSGERLKRPYASLPNRLRKRGNAWSFGRGFFRKAANKTAN